MPDDAWLPEVTAMVAGWTRATLADAVGSVRGAIARGASPTHAADLALAFGVARGDPVATRRFEQHVGGDLAAAVRAIDRAPDFVAEIAQRIRIHLMVGATPRIATYGGRGPLRAWVAIAARRMALNAKRDARPLGDGDDDALAGVVDREPDPELRHLKMRYRAEFRDALAAALAALSDRARAVLRLRFVDGLELAQIGRIYRVHESTTSRWVAAALDDVGRITREQLVARLAITAGTADSVARMVHSGLDLSVARLLAR